MVLSEEVIEWLFRKSCCMISFGLVLGLYAIIALHFYAFVYVITPLMKSRLGTAMGMLWISVGLIILYNILFNHFWAMVIKPGSPKDQKKTEKLRHEQKNRANRKAPLEDITQIE